MFKSEIKEGTSVVTVDNKELGKVNGLVLDPGTNMVTDIVVEHGWPTSQFRVVPFAKVRFTTENRAILSDDIENFDQFPLFDESLFVRVRAGDQDVTSETANYPAHQGAPAYYRYPPYGSFGSPTVGLSSPTMLLKEGTKVLSADSKHIGNVERLLLEPGTNQATHFVITEGLFFEDRKLIPMSWIKSVSEDEVHLTVSSGVLEDLPSFQS